MRGVELDRFPLMMDFTLYAAQKITRFPLLCA